jgi:hypothetical protein
LDDLKEEVEINSAWEPIRENIKIWTKEITGYFQLKKHKPWFDEWCSKIIRSKVTSQISVVTGSQVKKLRII